MYLILILLVPFLLMFNTRLAIGAFVAAIVWMVIARTRTPASPRRRRAGEPEYEPGYKF